MPPRAPEASTKSGAPRGWSDPFRAVDTVSRTAPARHCSSWHCSSWPVLWRNFPRDPFGRCVLAGSGPLNDTQPSSLVSAVEPVRNFPRTPFGRCAPLPTDANLCAAEPLPEISLRHRFDDAAQGHPPTTTPQAHCSPARPPQPRTTTTAPHHGHHQLGAAGV